MKTRARILTGTFVKCWCHLLLLKWMPWKWIVINCVYSLWMQWMRQSPCDVVKETEIRFIRWMITMGTRKLTLAFLKWLFSSVQPTNENDNGISSIFHFRFLGYRSNHFLSKGAAQFSTSLLSAYQSVFKPFSVYVSVLFS